MSAPDASAPGPAPDAEMTTAPDAEMTTAPDAEMPTAAEQEAEEGVETLTEEVKALGDACALVAREISRGHLRQRISRAAEKEGATERARSLLQLREAVDRDAGGLTAMLEERRDEGLLTEGADDPQRVSYMPAEAESEFTLGKVAPGVSWSEYKAVEHECLEQVRTLVLSVGEIGQDSATVAALDEWMERVKAKTDKDPGAAAASSAAAPTPASPPPAPPQEAPRLTNQPFPGAPPPPYKPPASPEAAAASKAEGQV